jgi:hypothetical protein
MEPHKGATDAVTVLRATFLAEARAKLRWADAESRVAASRPIRHILLLHLGVLDADSVEQLLTDYERMGVRWISFDDALADPVYQDDLRVPEGGNFLFQLVQARGLVAPPQPQPSMKLFDALCP